MNELAFQTLFDIPIETLYRVMIDDRQAEHWLSVKPAYVHAISFDARPGGKGKLVVTSPVGFEKTTYQFRFGEMVENQLIEVIFGESPEDECAAITGELTFQMVGQQSQVAVRLSGKQDLRMLLMFGFDCVWIYSMEALRHVAAAKQKPQAGL